MSGALKLISTERNMLEGQERWGGDIFIAMNGMNIGSIDELQKFLGTNRARQIIKLTVLRDTQILDFLILPEENQQPA